MPKESRHLKVLITGCRGFVGSCCAKQLAPKHEIVGMARSECSLNYPSIMIEDIGPNTNFSKILDSFEVIVHCAAYTHQENGDPQEAYRVNLEGTVALAKAAIQSQVKLFIFISSVHALGRTGEQLREDDPPRPDTDYGLSKLQAELALKHLGQTSEMKIVVLRPPPIYGEMVKGAFPKLVHGIDRWPILPIPQSKSQRSYIYVENLCHSIGHIIDCEPKLRKYQIYHIRDAKNLSLREFIRLVAKARNKKIVFLTIPQFVLKILLSLLGRRSDFERSIASLTVNQSKIYMELGWQPPISTEEGVQKSFRI